MGNAPSNQFKTGTPPNKGSDRSIPPIKSNINASNLNAISRQRSPIKSEIGHNHHSNIAQNKNVSDPFIQFRSITHIGGSCIGSYYDQPNGNFLVVSKHQIEIFQVEQENFSDSNISRPNNVIKADIVHICSAFIEDSKGSIVATGDEDGKIRLYEAKTGQFKGIFPFAENQYMHEEEGEEGEEEDYPTESVQDSIASDEEKENLFPVEEPKDDRKDDEEAEVESQFDDELSSSSFSVQAPSQYQSNPVKCLAVVSTDKIIAGHEDGTVRLYSRKFGSEIATFIPESTVASPVTCLSYHSVRQSIVVGFMDGSIKIFNITENSTTVSDLMGHTNPILAISIAKTDLIVSSSSDNTIRLWDLNSGQQLYGYRFFAQALFYDEMRDILFCGTNDGICACAKIIKNLSTTQPAEIKILKKIQVHRASINSIWYSTFHDALTTVAVDNRAALCPNITGIAYETALKKASRQSNPLRNSIKQPLDSVEEIRIPNDHVDELLNELKVSESTQRAFPSGVAEAERKVLEMSLKITQDDSEAEESRKEHLIQHFDKMEKDLNSLLDEINVEWQSTKKELLKKYINVLDPDIGNKKLEARIDKKREELKARQEKEWIEFNNQADQERKMFSEQIPIQKSRAAAQVLSLKKKYLDQQSQIEADMAISNRKLVFQNMPIINNTYQIGNPITKSTASVFKGLDINSLEIVAIKAFPSFVTLDTSLQHSTLVPILDVCPTEGTVFVVMKMMKENLSDLVKREPFLDQPTIAQIVYTTFKCLAYLHSNRMVVRDLRPQHILLDESAKPKLIHLGVMRSLMGTIESEPPEENRIYAAPELFGRVVKGSSDIWSLGCVFLYLLQTPEERETELFYGQDSIDILLSMINVVGRPSSSELQVMGDVCKMDEEGIELLKYIDNLPNEECEITSPLSEKCTSASASAMDLLGKMLRFSPSERISAVDALNHPYFQEFGLRPSQSECELHPHTDLTTFSEYSDNENELEEHFEERG